MSWFVRLLGLIPALGGFAAACLLVPDGQALQVPTVPTVTVPTITVPTVTVTTPTVSVPTPVPVPSTPTATVTVAPPPVPAPTVPTTAPVPTPVPAPSPPPVRIAPAPPPVSLPGTTTVPVPGGTPSTTGRATPSPAGQPGTATSGGGSAEAQPSGSSSSGGSVAGAAVTRGGSNAGKQTGSRPLDARSYRTKNRVSVRLRFSLPAAGRLFLIVRGPAPSCRVAGVVPLRGRREIGRASCRERV